MTAANTTEMVHQWYLCVIMVDFGSVKHNTRISVIIDGCVLLYRSKIDLYDE